jgi:hypothetical protein
VSIASRVWVQSDVSVEENSDFMPQPVLHQAIYVPDRVSAVIANVYFNVHWNLELMGIVHYQLRMYFGLKIRKFHRGKNIPDQRQTGACFLEPQKPFDKLFLKHLS